MRFELRAHLYGYGGWGTAAEHHDRMRRLASELMSVSGTVFAPEDELCSEVALHIRLLSPERGEVELPSPLDMLDLSTPRVFMECSTAIEVSPEVYRRSAWVRAEHLTEHLEMVAMTRMDEALAALAFALSIAMPDEVHISDPEFQPKHPDHFESAVSSHSLRRGVVLAEELGWPPLSTVPLQQVVAWLHALPGWREGIGRGGVGRAVAALSQALKQGASRSTPLHLLWAMVGLEALYVRGLEGLSAQLIAKVQLLLGPFPTHKKRFGRVYRYRSRFVHGDVDVPFAYRERGEDADVWQFIWESDNEGSLAAITLLASIQELIRRGWYDLAYEWAIIPPPAEPPRS